MSQNVSTMLRRFYGGPAPQQNERQPSPTVANLRDRAIVGMLWHASATADAAIAARVKDYYTLTGQRWLRLRENGAERTVLVPAQLEMLFDEYLTASDIADQLDTPLFRSTLSGTGKISTRTVPRHHVVKLGRNIANLRSVNLTTANAEAVISSIWPADPAALRDRAIIGMMVYAGATPKEIAAIRTYDYLANNEWCCVKLGRSRIAEVPKPLHLLLREYLRAATPDEHAPLFGVDRSRSMTPANIQRMVRRRLEDLSTGQEAGRPTTGKPRVASAAD
jgi:site-specific recombinase XerD